MLASCCEYTNLQIELMYNNTHAVYTGYEYGCPHDNMTGNALKETTNICIDNITLKNRQVFFHVMHQNCFDKWQTAFF